MARVHVKASDVLIDLPIEWDLFDAKGHLIFAKGAVIGSEAEKAALLHRRPLRDLKGRHGHSGGMMNGAEKSAAAHAEHRHEVRLALEDARLSPGDSIQLQGNTGEDRHTVKLIGYLKGRSVIVTNPTKDGAPVYLREGETFVARTFSGKLACAFPCMIVANPVKPFAHVHLSYPPEVRGISVRRGERVEVRTIAAFDRDNGSKGSGVIVNMSTGGAMMMSRSDQLAAGARLSVKFKILVAEVEHVMDIDAMVRSARASEDENEPGTAYGLQFVDMSAEDNLVLATCVFQQLAEHRLS